MLADATVIVSDNFNAADSTCWASRPNGGGTENIAGCASAAGLWAPISDPPYGTPPSVLRAYPHAAYAHSSPEAIGVTYPSDEALSLAQYNFSENHIFLTQWMNFAPGFDFPLGLKIGRVDSWDSVMDVSFSDFIMVAYCTVCTGGMDDMGGLTFARNGGENFGYADGVSFTRGTWYKVSIELKLNDIDSTNGLARMWVNDSLVIQRTGMGGTDMRPVGGGGPMTFFRLGGWYSNSGVAPFSPSTVYIDDVCADNAAACNVSPGDSCVID